MKLYLVRVETNYAEDGFQDLGIFSSKENAEKVAENYNSKGNYDHANIYEYELNQVYED